MCLHSWPRAGSIIRRNVIGHLSDTLMAVCSTPSSPFKVLLFVTLVKFLLTAMKIIILCTTQRIISVRNPKFSSFLWQKLIPNYRQYISESHKFNLKKYLWLIGLPWHTSSKYIYIFLIKKWNQTKFAFNLNCVSPNGFKSDLLFVIQCSAGRRRFFNRPCRTDRTLGRWTNCSTNRWDWNEKQIICIMCIQVYLLILKTSIYNSTAVVSIWQTTYETFPPIS